MSTSTGESSRRFFLGGGGGVLAKAPSQGILKTKNSTDLSHYFLEGPKFTFEKMSDLPSASGVPQIIENVTEVDFFYVGT